MPSVQFTSHLRKVAPAGTITVGGGTLRAALDEIFARHPQVKSYVLDDQERLRKHVVIFVDGARVSGGSDLMLPVNPSAQIYVLQALSGG
ncbi:MoaD/ThiS family protein [Dongia sedimenti]|uniref:MoaD/ThiS family protein n=1 Tax=Dongia sedimenti TaxID=3064282 RepID=A0ABU0YFM3_9PROT|nr:MoaD/ThiS family protein [Rhodospirillaceae bacterium R-7]